MIFGFWKDKGKPKAEKAPNDPIASKKEPAAQPDKITYTNETLFNAAHMLKLQLAICKGSTGYQRFVNGAYARGYFWGWFDAALQDAGIDAECQDDLVAQQVVGHMALFNGNSEEGMEYLVTSLPYQDDHEFIQGMNEGGGEYIGLITGKIKAPNKLAARFHNLPTANL
ncbi:hypothetical protein ACYPKM_03965 [Pseudomonas aeruginosa]